MVLVDFFIIQYIIRQNTNSDKGKNHGKTEQL